MDVDIRRYNRKKEKCTVILGINEYTFDLLKEMVDQGFQEKIYVTDYNVSDFYKKISYINLSKKGIEVIGKQAITLAEYENLEGHAQSIRSRIRRN